MQVSGCSNTIRWYNTNANSYANAISGYVQRNLIDQFLGELPARRAEITDVGCAAGRDSNVFAQEKVIKRVSGIDLSYGLIKIARRWFPEVDFVKANFLNLPHEHSSLHGVWALAAIVHLDTKEDAIRSIGEFNRVLKRNGNLFLCVKEKLGNEETEIVEDKLSNGLRFFRYYTVDELQTYIEANGFKIVDLQINRDKAGRNTSWINVFSRKVRIPRERTIDAIIQRVNKHK
ncbi:MAG: class I SAM-dependent methyltransferase [Candidatus Melainabacteria bacterium]|nr:class I SAM-dependent methyltransferase [Candidatus Melainabacteria bacterium]